MNLLYLTALKVTKFLFEAWLARLNKRFYEDKNRQKEVCEALKIKPSDLDKSVTYANDKLRLQEISELLSLFGFCFLYFGGFRVVETFAKSLSHSLAYETVLEELFLFFLFLFKFFLSLPFEYYATFVIEEKHGFNRQSVKTFSLIK